MQDFDEDSSLMLASAFDEIDEELYAWVDRGTGHSGESVGASFGHAGSKTAPLRESPSSIQRMPEDRQTYRPVKVSGVLQSVKVSLPRA